MLRWMRENNEVNSNTFFQKLRILYIFLSSCIKFPFLPPQAIFEILRPWKCKPVSSFLFNIVFCAMLGAINVILKAKIGGGKEEKAGDRVLPSLIMSSLAYATLASMWPENLPQVDIGGARKSFWSMLLREFISTIVLTFSNNLALT